MLAYVALEHSVSPEDQKDAIERIRTTLRGNRTKTLIVEDSEADAFLAMRVLGEHGIDTDWVSTVEEAVGRILTGDYKIVFLDLKLGPCDGQGADILRAIQRLGLQCEVIVLTGEHATDSVKCTEALKLGAVAVMMKPLTTKEVQLVYGIP
jgi:DNA-binding response OmpR family regulator